MKRRTFLGALGAGVGGAVVRPQPSDQTDPLLRELRAYLDTLHITSENIGDIRRSLFVSWDSERNEWVRDPLFGSWESPWNAWVRDETAARENADSRG